MMSTDSEGSRRFVLVRLVLSGFLEILGLTAVAVGLWMLAPWLGVTALGVGLLVLGLAVDPPRWRSS